MLTLISRPKCSSVPGGPRGQARHDTNYKRPFGNGSSYPAPRSGQPSGGAARYLTRTRTHYSGRPFLSCSSLELQFTQQIGNALGWGLVDDTPNAFVWEIGHTSNFSTPAGKLCYPAEISSYCPAYGGPYCTYPWYAFNSAYGAITFGVGCLSKPRGNGSPYRIARRG